MKVGVSTACLFPAFTEEALKELLDAGVQRLEVFLNCPSETTPQFARELRRMADGYGAEIVSVHPCSSEYEGVNFFGRYPRRFADAAEEYKKLFEVCNVLGADIVPFHGARAHLPISQQVYFERFDRLSEIASSFSVRLCQENVVHFFSGNVDFISEMCKQLPSANMLLDIKQAKRAGVCPFVMLEAMKNNLCHIHVSDHNNAFDCLPIGDGNFNFGKFVAELNTLKYTGSMIVELYRTNFTKTDQLLKSQENLNNF